MQSCNLDFRCYKDVLELCRGSESLQKQISVSQKQPIAYLRKKVPTGNQPGLTSSQVKCKQCTTWEFVSFACKNCSFKAQFEVVAKQVSAVVKQLYSTKWNPSQKETLSTGNPFHPAHLCQSPQQPREQ